MAGTNGDLTWGKIFALIGAWVGSLIPATWFLASNMAELRADVRTQGAVMARLEKVADSFESWITDFASFKITTNNTIERHELKLADHEARIRSLESKP